MSAQPPGQAPRTAPATTGAQLPTLARETTAENPWPVRELSPKIQGYIAKMDPVWVEGQVIQFKEVARIGLAFLTLRDVEAEMSLPVTVRTTYLRSAGLEPKPGDRVVLHAKPGFWPKSGSFQLDAREIRAVGIGELLARIEHLKGILRSEGLFDEQRKKPLPFVPQLVGLVTGQGGDAEHDVVNNARRRWPGVRFAIRHAAVQGAGAAAAVTAALQELDADPEVDVIVIARGGGNVEHLLPFSDERLLRAVAAARTPVVSAIGHEQDRPLLDEVADFRASTPTDAGKRIVPDLAEETRGLTQARGRIRQAVEARLRAESERLAALRSRPAMADPQVLLDRHREQISAAQVSARRCMAWALQRADGELEGHRGRLRALSPAATLERGYAVLRTHEGTVVRSPGDVEPGDQLEALLAHGRIAVEVGMHEDDEWLEEQAP